MRLLVKRKGAGAAALGGHFYTISESEKDKLVTQYPDTWPYEGVPWHAYE